MEELLARLETLLRQQFAGSQPMLETYAPERVGGFLLWDQFAPMEQIEWQRLVWNALHQYLSATDQTRISAILTLTPDESQAMQEQPQSA